MALDVSQIAQQMLDVVLPILSKGGAKTGGYAGLQFQRIAKRVKAIAEDVASGKIHADDAPMLLEMQEDAIKAVIITVEGLSEIVIEEAVNAALSVVKGIVKGLPGIGLVL